MVIRPVFGVALAAVVIGAVGIVALHELANRVRHSPNYRIATELRLREHDASISARTSAPDMTAVARYVRGERDHASPFLMQNARDLQAETAEARRVTKTTLAGVVPRGQAGRRLNALLFAALRDEVAWGNHFVEAAAAFDRDDRAASGRALDEAMRALSRCAEEFHAADAVAPRAIKQQWSFSMHFG